MTRVTLWLLFGGVVAATCVIVAVNAQTALPEGEGKAVVERMCGTSCHSIQIVTAQRLSPPRWAEVVDEMVIRGAQGTDQEIERVIRYLSTHFSGPERGGSRAREAAPARWPGSQPAAAVGVSPAALSRSMEAAWPSYGHDPGARRYSPVAQITPENVRQLERVWTYQMQRPASDTSLPPTRPGPGAGNGAGPSGASQDMPEAAHIARRGRMSQVTPLVINDMMYLALPPNKTVALEPETGREIWSHEIQDMGGPTLRGLAYWPGNGHSPPTLFLGTSRGFLVALNARTGRPVAGFAEGGVLDLRRGMTDKFPDANYGMSSPPAIYKNLVITGSRVQEQPELGPPGDVRAWDVRTGELVWTFHTVPRPGEPGHETWAGESWRDRSGANVWGIMTVDVERGLVFLPLGSATYDYYGGDRKGANLYGSTLVALDAETGTLKWHFQTTHHDIWDYDLQAPPVVIEVKRGDEEIPAVAQMTKQALLFILDRRTGEPIYGVDERPVPQDGFAAGEHPWPTQPFPVKPPPLARNSFRPDEIANVTPDHRQHCMELVEKDGGFRTGGPYLPFGPEPSLIFPGTLGGGNWHGVSYNPELGYLFVNTQNLGEVYQIVDDPEGGPIAERWKFWDADKFWPCQQPPWGELAAVDVNTGEIAWQVPLGGFDELEARGVPKTGAPNIGGSIATAGGLVFVGGTVDSRFRAFNARTGDELWVTEIGAAAHAVPITYLGRNGKQYVAVMVSGGGFLGDHTIPATLMVYALEGNGDSPHFRPDGSGMAYGVVRK